MSTAILFLVLFQAGATGNVSQPRILSSATVGPDFVGQSQVDDASFEEREFVQRVNGLSRALSDFAETYNSGKIDLKKVKALRKAIHELERSEWFRPQKRGDHDD